MCKEVFSVFTRDSFFKYDIKRVVLLYEIKCVQ